MNSRYKYLSKNALVFGISAFATKFLSFLLLPLYTDILTTAEYGNADIIATTANILIFILTIDIADSVVRYSINNKNHEEVLSYGMRVLWMGSVVCILGCLAAFYLRIMNWPLSFYLFLFATFFSTSLYSIISAYLRGIDKIFEVGVAGVLSSFAIIVLNIIFLKFLHAGITGYLLSMCLGPLVASIYSIAVSGASLRIYICCICDYDMRSQMRKYCTPLIFNNIALWINTFLDRYFIIAMCGADENGIYSMANKIPVILSTCFAIFTQAWGLSAIHEIDSDDSEEFFSKIYNIYIAVVLLICSFLIFCSVFLAKILFKGEFFNAWMYSPILLVSVAVNALTAFVGSIFSASKKTKAIATTTIISAITNISFNAILIPIMGVMGAAIATLLSYFVMLIIRLVLSRSILQLRINYIRDIAAFGVILLQIYLNHFDKHFYIGQAICFVALFILFYRTILDVLQRGRNIISSKFLKKRE